MRRFSRVAESGSDKVRSDEERDEERDEAITQKRGSAARSKQ